MQNFLEILEKIEIFCFFTFVTFNIPKHWPFFKQKLSRAGAHGKKIEGALDPALGRYCETGGTREVQPGRGVKGAPGSALLRAPSSLALNSLDGFEHLFFVYLTSCWGEGQSLPLNSNNAVLFMNFEVSKCFEIPYKTALFEFNSKDWPTPHHAYSFTS